VLNEVAVFPGAGSGSNCWFENLLRENFDVYYLAGDNSC